jgi:hypothetical protein
VKQDAVNDHHLSNSPFQRRNARTRRLIFALLAGMIGISSTGAWAQARAAKKTTKQEQAQQELLATQEAAVAALKEEFEKRLAQQEADSKKREETLREEAKAATAKAQKSVEDRVAEEKAAREKEVTRLQTALDANKAERDKRQSEAPPVVGALGRGLSLYGLVHADLMVQQGAQDQVNPDNGQPLNTDRFLIRRARLGARMDRTYGEGGMEIDGNTINGPAFRLIDAHASVKLPGSGGLPLLMATIGFTRIPFGSEVPQEDKDRFFLERSIAARALFPDEYDLGLRLMGGWHFLRYAVAVQNGEPLGAGRFAGLDPNKKKDIVGRVGIEDEVIEGIYVVGGASALTGTGFHPGASATKPAITWGDSNGDATLQPSELTGVPGSAASPSANFSRFGVGGDLLVAAKTSWLGNTTFAAQVYFANDLDRGLQPADPLASPAGGQARSFRELGYNIALTQQLTPLAAVGVRYDFYDPDRDAYNRVTGNIVPNDSSYSSISITGMLIGSGWGRAILEYDINRNHLGLDSSGNPTNLASNAFILRGEVYF